MRKVPTLEVPVITILGLLLVTNSAATRGTVLVSHPTPQNSVVVVGRDTLHLATSATLGSCGVSIHSVRELGSVADSSFIKSFPGDPARLSRGEFASVGWSNWSTISPGATCYARVRQDSGGMRFRYRKIGDVLVLMDTLFHAIVDTHTVSGWPYRAVVNVQSRWSHAPYDAKQTWVRWVDSLDFVYGKTFSHANHPLITLTDSMAIDSIAPAFPREKRNWNLRIDAVERSGKAWTFDMHGLPGSLPAGSRRGAGVRLPPGTTFRFQAYSEEGAEVNADGKRIRVLQIWSKGKVIDSLIAIPTGIYFEKVLRKRTPTLTSSSVKSFDARGRRDRESPEVGQGADNVTGAKSLEIRFGK